MIRQFFLRTLVSCSELLIRKLGICNGWSALGPCAPGGGELLRHVRSADAVENAFARGQMSVCSLYAPHQGKTLKRDSLSTIRSNV